MYSWSSVKTAIRQPRAILAQANRVYDLGFRRVPDHNESGLDVLAEDWDQLIILDACRYDVFEELATDLPGDLQRVESRASSTTNFFRANFADTTLLDTVYVTASPQVYRSEQSDDPIGVTFHDSIEVWKEHWHETHRTVMPGPVTDAALDAAAAYPDKRLLIHYLQPHAPFVGPTGREELPTEHLNFWTYFRNGDIDVSLDTIKLAYRENLELVLPHVAELLAAFDGRTVVTSDHGELLGERDSPIPIRQFGHPRHTNLPALLEVPWLVHERNGRPAITVDEPRSSENDVDMVAVEQRLRDLGYAD